MTFLQKISKLVAIASLLIHTINGDTSQETGETIVSTPDQSKQCNGCKAQSTTYQPGGAQPDCLKLEWNGIETDGECYESEEQCVNIKPCTFHGDVVVTNKCDFSVNVRVDGYTVASGWGLRPGENRSFRIGKYGDKPRDINCGEGSSNMDQFGWHLKVEVFKYVKVDKDDPHNLVQENFWTRIAKFRIRCSECSPNEYL